MPSELLSGLPQRLEPFELPQAEVDEALERLSSPWTEECLALDPYWPKWDSPWWYLTLLHEMGLAGHIPHTASRALTDAIVRHYHRELPFRREDLPEGLDFNFNVMCHCGLGTIYSVLSAAGIDVDAAMPWARPWFLRYQLPDGGLNCDEAAYLTPMPHSSMVSTLPPLEAVLFHVATPTADEEKFLARGTAYLLERALHRGKTTGAVIEDDWLIPTFPRFYEYDVLRALRFVTHWAQTRQQSLRVSDIREAVGALSQVLDSRGQLRLARSFALEAETRYFMNGHWVKGFPATTFPLLEAVSRAGDTSPYLTRQWLDVADSLHALDKAGLLYE